MKSLPASLAALIALPALHAHADGAAKAPKHTAAYIKKFRSSNGMSPETSRKISSLHDDYRSLFSSYGHPGKLLEELHAAGSLEAAIDKAIPKPVVKTGFLSKSGNRMRQEEYDSAVKHKKDALSETHLAFTTLAAGLPAAEGKRVIGDPYHPAFDTGTFMRTFTRAMKRYQQKRGAGDKQRWLEVVNHSLTKQIKANRSSFMEHLEKSPIEELAGEVMKLHGELLGASSGVKELERVDYTENGSTRGTSGEVAVTKNPLFAPKTTVTKGASKGDHTLTGSVETKQISAIRLDLKHADGSGVGKDHVDGRFFLEKALRLADVYGAVLKRAPKVAAQLQHLVEPEIQIAMGSSKQSFRIDMVKGKLAESHGFGSVLGEERQAMLREQLDQEQLDKL